MDTTKNYFATGIFVLVGVLLFCMTFYFLSNEDSIFSSKKRVYSYFKETQGLMFGSIVSFSGITIGNVRSITYSPERGALKVTYTIKESFLPLIKEDSYAQLKTQGALGDRYIFISPGSNQSTPIAPNGEIQSKKTSDIFNMVEEKIKSIPNLDKITEKTETLIDVLNSEEGLKGSLKELKYTLAETKKTFTNINKNKDHEKVLKRLDSILLKIDRGQGSLGRFINDPTLYNKIQGFLGDDKNSRSYLKELGQKTIRTTESTDTNNNTE